MAFRNNNRNQSQRHRYNNNNFSETYNNNNIMNRDSQQIRPQGGRKGAYRRNNRGYGHTPNTNLQINSSRFGRPSPSNDKNNQYPTPYTRGNGKGRRERGKATGGQHNKRAPRYQQRASDHNNDLSESEFPNGWVKQCKSTQPIYHIGTLFLDLLCLYCLLIYLHNSWYILIDI